VRAIYRMYRQYLSSCHVASLASAGAHDEHVQWSMQVLSDILWVTLVACVLRTSRESFAYTRARAHGPRRFMVKTACIQLYVP